MDEKTFEVLFAGRLVEGADPAQVKTKVAALFKVEVAKIERLFSGATVPIKKGVDEATAKKYQLALHKAGAICQVVNRAETAQSPAEAAAVTPPPQPASSGEVGLQKSVVKDAPSGFGDLASAAIDEPGTTLVAHQEVAAPQIDTSSLSVDASGEDLIEHREEAALQVDLSGLSMGESGETISESRPVEPLQVDTAALSMDEPGSTLVEHEEVAVPDIDTGTLSLD